MVVHGETCGWLQGKTNVFTARLNFLRVRHENIGLYLFLAGLRDLRFQGFMPLTNKNIRQGYHFNHLWYRHSHLARRDARGRGSQNPWS
jgi:hypothetical protein